MTKVLEIIKRDFDEEQWESSMSQIEILLTAISSMCNEEMKELNKDHIQFELNGEDEAFFIMFSKKNHVEEIRSYKERITELEKLVGNVSKRTAINE